MHSLDTLESKLQQLAKEVIDSDNKNNTNQVKLAYQNPVFTYYLPMGFENIANIFILLKNNDISKPSFTKS